jgi:hypothetical protein
VTALMLALLLAQAAPQLVEVEPLRCWWRTSAGAVAVGQPFTLGLTCAVLENDSVRVVPDQSPLAVGTVQLAPFELVGGSHPADLRSGQRRFFQYEYTLRIIDPNVIGQDVKLPDLSIHYRVESRVQAQSLEGRDRTYLLPAQSVHVTSMVPADAADIRDASNEPFGQIEALRFRSRVLNITAMALAGLGLLLFVPAVFRALFVARQVRTSDKGAMSDRAVLAVVASELSDVQTEARGGASPELAARALPAARIAAGYALGRPPRQRSLDGDAAAGEARLLVTTRGTRRRRVAVASPTTAEDVARVLERLPLTTPHERRSLLEDLRGALMTLTKSAYSSNGSVDADLDEAIRAVARAAEQLRREYGWLKTQTGRLARRG